MTHDRLDLNQLIDDRRKLQATDRSEAGQRAIDAIENLIYRLMHKEKPPEDQHAEIRA